MIVVLVVTIFFQVSAFVLSIRMVLKRQSNRFAWGGLGTVFLLRAVSTVLINMHSGIGSNPAVLFAHRWLLPMIMSGLLLLLLHWFVIEVKTLNRTSGDLGTSRRRYYNIFNLSAVSLTEEDVGEIREELFSLGKGMKDKRELKDFLLSHPEKTAELMGSIKILDVNETTCKLFGASSKEEMITRYSRTFSDKSEEVFAELCAALWFGESSLQRETVLKKISGEEFPCIIKVRLPEAGKSSIALVSVVDLTEQQRMERKVARERLMAEKYLDIVEVIIVIYDRNGIIRKINRKGAELFGYSEAELVGKNWFDVAVLPENRGWLKRKFRKIMAGEKPYNPLYDEDLLTKSGEIIHIEWRAVPLYDRDGTLVENLCSGIDVTELRKKQAALAKSELRMKAVEELAQIGYWEIDKINKKVFWSEGDYKILELDPEETVPSADLFLSLVHPDDRDDAEKSMQHSIEQHVDWIATYRLCIGGKVKYVADWAHHFYNDDGTVSFTTGLMKDITEEVINKQNQEQLLQEKDALLRELNHRTKNNMQVISGMLNLRAGMENDLRVSEVFLEIDRKIQSMALAHEKLYKSADLSHVDFREYFKELVTLLKESYDTEKRGITIVTEIDNIGGLIDIAVPCGLILNELITNSLKYAFAPGKGGVIRIVLRKETSGIIVMTVSDTGAGMEAVPDDDKLDSLGIRTIHALGRRQLRGEVEWDVSRGVTCTIRFRDDIYSKRI